MKISDARNQNISEIAAGTRFWSLTSPLVQQWLGDDGQGTNGVPNNGIAIVARPPDRSQCDGTNNTVIGTNANVGASNLNFATAIGASDVVSTSNTVVLGRRARTPCEFPAHSTSPRTAPD